MRNVLITGGAGFIGCNLVRHLLSTDESLCVLVLDKLTYAGSLHNLKDIATDFASRYTFVKGDICDGPLVTRLLSEHQVDTVIHLAAESHVDRSIDSPADFLRTNVMGTCTLLESAREVWKERQDVRFHHVSTDEVYGSLGTDGLFTEETPYDPSSPYSASKASSDHFVRAWHRTYGLPITISNCSNNYGPYQFPEKLIPLMICKALAQEPMPVYGDGMNVRDWLHTDDHCKAIERIVRAGVNGETYNVGGNSEYTNIGLVHLLCDLLDELRPNSSGSSYRELITFVKDRPGHDLRYAIDASKMKTRLQWEPMYTFEKGLRDTVQWYLDNDDWIQAVTKDKHAHERRGLSPEAASEGTT